MRGLAWCEVRVWRGARAVAAGLLGVWLGGVCAERAGAGAEPALEARLVIPDALLFRPSFLVAPRGDATRVYVGEQTGPVETPYIAPIHVFSLPCYQDLGVFLEVPELIAGGEAGLIGMAFHPGYAENGRFYVFCTATPDHGVTMELRLIEYLRDPKNPDRALPEGRRLLTIPDLNSGHNGGWIDFGLDGYLYIAIGDGGGSNDEGEGHIEPTGNAQSFESLHGKVLRIDVDGSDAPGGQYGIPETNPFAPFNNPDFLEEIWAYGLRNPWRCDIDPVTGDLYIADVGQEKWEEINVQARDFFGEQGARNYGWRCYEGDEAFNQNGGLCLPFGLGNVGPVLKVGHFWLPVVAPVNRVSCAVMGGVVYRGSAIPEIAGRYFFADWCFNWVYSVRVDALTQTFADGADHTEELATARGMREIVSFGRDGLGEVYILAGSGVSGPAVWKIVRAGEGPGPCECVGDFNNDRSRDILDLVQLLGSFGRVVTPGANGDCNGDGRVSTEDLPLFLARLGVGCS